VEFDEQKVKAGQEGMVTAVPANGDFGLVVLGGSHDLSGAVPVACEYMRVWVKEWPGWVTLPFRTGRAGCGT
jgi:hypothetical protein